MRQANESEKSSTVLAWVDPDDAPDLSQPEWTEKLATAAVKRGRPRSPRPKLSTTIRLDADVMAAFRAEGEGWQTRINSALREWLARNTDSDAPKR
jgi:uncharacterized protein (DUF4415 family)